jgi:hypothetical protein
MRYDGQEEGIILVHPINVIYAVIAILAAGCGAVGWFIKEFREI